MQAPPSPERGPTYTATTRGTDRSPLSTPLCFYRANHSNPNTVIHVTAHAHTPFELPAIPHLCSSAKRIAKPMADAISQECVVMMRTTCGKHPATPFPDPQGADPITDAANLVAVLPALTTQGPALAVSAVLMPLPPVRILPTFLPSSPIAGAHLGTWERRFTDAYAFAEYSPPSMHPFQHPPVLA